MAIQRYGLASLPSQTPLGLSESACQQGNDVMVEPPTRPPVT